MTNEEMGIDAYENAWRNGPKIEEWLQAGRVTFDDLQALIENDLIYRKKLGRQPTQDEYSARFPGNNPVVEAAFVQAAADAADEVEKFGNYHVVPEMKCRIGGMGVVWPVKRNGDGDLLAAKVTRSGNGLDVTSIKAEISTLEGLASSLQYVVPLFDHGMQGKESYYIMPWYEADNLDDWCGQKETKYVLKMLIPVIRELNTIHTKDVIHQDIKPKNLLFDESNHKVLLSDFGLARRVHQFSGKSVSGTDHYIAPELYQGDDATIQSDIYAFGATLFRLISGKHPFGTSSGEELKRRVLAEEPPQLSRVCRTVKRDLSAIIGKCLERDPARRYSTMNELADELQRFLDDEPVNARPPSWYEQSRRWRRRNRFASRTFTVTIVLLLAVIVWDYIAFERDRRKLGLNFQQAVQDFKRDSEIHAEVVKCHEAAVANSELARNELEAETKKLNALLMESNATNSKLHEHLGKSITEMTDQVREMRDITAVMIEGAESQIEIGTLAMKAVNDLQDLAANFGDLQEPRVIQALEQLKAQHEGFRTDVQSLKAKIRKHMSGLTSLEETLDEHQELNDQSRQDDQKLKQVLENVNATKDERIPPVP